MPMRAPEEGALYDAEHIERVEAELDSFIEKRAREAKDANRIEELWAKSERDHREKRRQANGWAWISHHEALAHTLRDLAGEHDAKANHVRELLGQPIAEKEGEMNSTIAQQGGGGSG